jgi:aldose sugar dehydrogenase
MRLAAAVSTAALVAFAAACADAEPQAAPRQTGAPVETRPAEDPSQQPAFAGQTRAPSVTTSVALEHRVVTDQLENPWGLEPMPDGRWLVTEKGGALRIVSASGQISEPVAGLPAVDARGQGGLLDVAVSPTFAQDRMVYWSYTEPRDGGNATSVARGRLSTDGRTLGDVQVIFRATPTYDGDKHYGSRLAFDPAGHLFVTLGERSDMPMRPQAQDLGSHMGKTIRINADGTVPADNPFVGRAGALPEIWSLGHRNVQGLAIQPGTGAIWTTEHGTRGGDEVNLDRAGLNYGWPEVAYGIEYSGRPGPWVQQREGTEQPVYYWDPVIAAGGADFYTGALVPEWQGDLMVAAMKEQHIARLVIENDRVVGEERLMTDLGARVRSVATGVDGALWSVTDSGQLVRLAPRGR